jgi:deoxyribonuclease-4
MGQHIGAKFEELGNIINAVDDPSLRVCLDTQHSFTAGYLLITPEGVKKMMSEFDKAIGPEKLAAVPANDSRQPCGSGIDRHDNIGEDLIGVAGFEAIMGHPAFRNLPFFLEVSGFEGNGPDQIDIDLLQHIRHRLGIDV